MPITRTRSSFVRQSVASLKAMAAFTVLLGLLYPLLIWGVGQAVARDQAAGSLVTDGGRVIGSSLLGQQWPGPGWFHGRPSASDLRRRRERWDQPRARRRSRAAVVGRRAALGVGAGALPRMRSLRRRVGWTRTSRRSTHDSRSTGSPRPAARVVGARRAAGRQRHAGPGPRLPRRAAGQCPRAQPGPGRRDRPMRPDAREDRVVKRGRCGSTSGQPRAWARPSPCSTRRTAGSRAAPTSSSASSRPTTGVTRRRC